MAICQLHYQTSCMQSWYFGLRLAAKGRSWTVQNVKRLSSEKNEYHNLPIRVWYFLIITFGEGGAKRFDSSFLKTWEFILLETNIYGKFHGNPAICFLDTMSEAKVLAENSDLMLPVGEKSDQRVIKTIKSRLPLGPWISTANVTTGQ